MSSTRQPSDTVQQAAIAWFARMRGAPDELERARFLAWLESPSNLQAWQEQLQLWEALEQPASAVGETGWYRPPAPRKRRPLIRWGLVASLLACAVAAAGAWRDPGLYQRSVADISTTPGEQRRITLDDGSMLLLDGDTALDLEISAQGRWITLRRGRAAFHVANIDTPFVVRSGKAEIHDLSTRFVVERRDGGANTVVEEGAVRIEGVGAQAFEVHAGQRVKWNDDLRQPWRHQVDVRALGAWQQGVLLYQNTPLAQVVLDLNRYSQERIVLTNAALRGHAVTGTFRIDDTATALRALEHSLGLRVTRVPGIASIIH